MEEIQAKKAMSKTEILSALANSTGLTKQQVAGLFEELSKLIGANLADSGPGVFAIPGSPANQGGPQAGGGGTQGINPFTKQPMVIKAKPAKNVVKLVALRD